MPARPPQSVPTQQALALLCGALVLVGCGTPPLPTSPVSSGTAAVAPTSTPTEASVRARVSLPSDGVIATEASLALSAFGSVWVPQIGNAHGWVVRIDGATGTVVARIAVGAAPGSHRPPRPELWSPDGLRGDSGGGWQTVRRGWPLPDAHWGEQCRRDSHRELDRDPGGGRQDHHPLPPNRISDDGACRATMDSTGRRGGYPADRSAWRAGGQLHRLA